MTDDTPSGDKPETIHVDFVTSEEVFRYPPRDPARAPAVGVPFVEIGRHLIPIIEGMIDTTISSVSGIGRRDSRSRRIHARRMKQARRK